MSKVASITRGGGLIVNPQHATPSTTQYARGYISEGAVVTDDLVLYLDAADYASFPGERSLAGAFSDYSSRQEHYDIVGDDGLIMLGTNTSYLGKFTSTIASSGDHTVMFDYWSDNDSVNFYIDNDGVDNNEFNATITANKKKATYSQTQNMSTTGSSTMYFKNNVTGSKVYIANYRFFKYGTTWRDLSGNGNDVTLVGGTTLSNAGGYGLVFDGVNDNGTLDVDSWIRSASYITMSGWWYHNANSAGAPFSILTDTDPVTSADGFWWHDSYSNGATLYLRTEDNSAGENGTAVGSGVFVSAGNWYHVAVVVGTNTFKLYYNGSLYTSWTPTFSWSSLRSDTAYLHLTKQHGSVGNGSMGNMQLYDRSLSAAEVKQNFNAERNRFGI